MDCNTKIKFRSMKEAEDYIKFELRDNEGLQAYECHYHRCWHMGHPKNYANNSVVKVHQILDKLSEEHHHT